MKKTYFSFFDKRNLDFMSYYMKRLLYPTQRPTIFNGFGYNPLFAFLRPCEFMLPISLFRTWGPDLVLSSAVRPSTLALCQYLPKFDDQK